MNAQLTHLRAQQHIADLQREADAARGGPAPPGRGFLRQTQPGTQGESRRGWGDGHDAGSGLERRDGVYVYG